MRYAEPTALHGYLKQNIQSCSSEGQERGLAVLVLESTLGFQNTHEMNETREIERNGYFEV
jgi:hypothetical protein